MLFAAACADPYLPETLPSAEHIGCLDIDVARGSRSEAAGPVVVYTLGNRCEHAIRVDLGAVHVVGIDEAERRIDMEPYDPGHAIGPRDMDARAHGEEWIEYHPIFPTPIFAVDVDVASVAVGEPPAQRVHRLEVR